MQDKRKWLPRWQRIELVDLCLERHFTRRQAAAWRRVSVSTVQYWIERYRAASPLEGASGAWAEDRASTPSASRAASATRSTTACARRASGPVGDRDCSRPS